MASTQSTLIKELGCAGFRCGDHIVLHSSFKSLGPAESGPDGVIDAILEVIGPEGNLMVPTFTYSGPYFKEPPFDHRKSASKTGVLSEFVRRRPAARRSFNPTHSVAVLGPQAQALTDNHKISSPMGTDSPLARMAQLDASILMLGTHQDSNSMIHCAEAAAPMPYLRVPYSEGQDFETAWFINERGETETGQVIETPGCSRGFRSLERLFKERGLMRTIRLGQASCQVLKANALIQVLVVLLKEQPDILLCRKADCRICPKRRKAGDVFPKELRR